MNFTNTDRAKIQVYGQFQIRHQVNKQVGWLVDGQVDGQVYLKVFYQFNLIKYKIKQEINR